MNRRWPERLWIVRHGQSAGNVARDLARASAAHRIDIALRDMDVPLSGKGEEQARALGRWFAGLAADERPDVVLASPYVRARGTAQAIGAAGGLASTSLKPCIDERLREREFGILDQLTTLGVRELQPEQAALRARLGKSYHRPPGGESWCDVSLRLRSLLDSLSLHHAGCRVLIGCHQVVGLCLRYLLEGLDEGALLASDAAADVANCAVTEYAFDPAQGARQLVRYNFTAPLEDAGAPVTSAPDRKVAPR